MRILITSGLSGGDVGGPAQYGPNLKKNFESLGHTAKLITYGKLEKILPVGLRHIWFFLKILPNVIRVDYLLALDTMSAGLPTSWAARLFRKKIIIRIGGDYLWSAYVNRTKRPITLPDFYRKMPKLNIKEKLTRFLIENAVKRANYLAFNTKWQLKIWQQYYPLDQLKIGVIRNFIPEKMIGRVREVKNFLWAGRIIPEKNLDLLMRVSQRIKERHPEFRLDIVDGEPHERILKKLEGCYAAISVAFADFCPNFIIEAVSFNKPFVMSRETGLDEIYPNGGIFVDPTNESEIESAIETLLLDERYDQYAEELKKFNFSRSWKKLAEEFLDNWGRV